MSAPDTPAGRDLLRRHPELTADEVGEVELQARGRSLQAEAERRERVLDAFRHLLTDGQRAAASAVLLLDPDPLAALDDAALRTILAGWRIRGYPRNSIERLAKPLGWRRPRSSMRSCRRVGVARFHWTAPAGIQPCVA